jgi:3-hydroxyisobutyrate dehydrogenase-like beta-hydroxyacid dehydrogenase
MRHVGLLHPGAMGAAFGNALVGAGHEVLWDSRGRSAATAARAERFTDAGDELLERAEIVLSICPPDRALEVAATAAAYDGVYVDANAIAPGTAARIAVPHYVDGGIVGSPAAPRLYLSGARANEVAALFAGTTVDARVLEGDPYSASALKMVYAAWTKGTAAMLLAIEAVATELGVANELHAEWADSQPDLPGRLERAESAAAAKGWRWAGEMREIAATFEAAGLPPGFHEAAASVYERPH